MSHNFVFQFFEAYGSMANNLARKHTAFILKNMEKTYIPS
jgi:hypothetical protein